MDEATAVIACIVEGQGDERALPVLVRRIAATVDPPPYITVRTALRAGRQALVKAGNLESAVEAAARQAGNRGAVLVLIDADDDCPAVLGPALLARAQAVRSNLPISVVLANREWEAWFLAAAHSLRNQRKLPSNLAPPPDPEAIRNAKGWLSDRMGKGRKYSEPADQPALTALFDLDAARRSADSFDKCYREIVRLIAALTTDGLPPGQSSSAPS